MTRADTFRYVVAGQTCATSRDAARLHRDTGAEPLGQMSGEPHPRPLGPGPRRDALVEAVRRVNNGDDTPWSRVASGVCRCGGRAQDLRGKSVRAGVLRDAGTCYWASDWDLVCTHD